MINEVFYPEMNQTNLLDSDLIVERLYKQYKVKCKEGIELVENKSIIVFPPFSPLFVINILYGVWDLVNDFLTNCFP